MKLSIRSKILLGFAVLLILSYITQVVGFNIANNFIRLQSTNLQQEKAENAADQIQNFIITIELDHLSITKEFIKSGGDNQKLVNVINYTFQQSPFMQKVTILSPTGRELLKVTPGKVEPPDSLYFEIPTDSFQTALNRKTGISKVYFADNAAVPLVDVFTPVVDSNNQVAAVIKSQIRLDQLWDVISTIKSGQSGFAYVVDEEGRLIAHPDNELVRKGTNLRSRNIINHLISGTYNPSPQNTESYVNEKNELVISSGTKIPLLNWIVVIEQTEKEAFNQLRVLRNLFYATLLGSLMLLFTVSLFLSENLARPLRKLNSFTNALTTGNLETRVIIKTGDEIEKLANSFNIMADRLKNSFVQLKQQISLLETQKARLDQGAKLLLRRDLDLRQTTESLEAEKESAEGERNKLAVLLAGITDGVIAVDLDRNVILFNLAAEQITGYKAKDVIGKPIDQLISILDKDILVTAATYCPIRKDFFEGVLFQKNNLKLTANNKSSYVNLISGKIKEGVAINLGCILTFHDVTEEQELERMKLDFVSMAAHELRTPLTTIRGYLSFLDESVTFKQLPSDEKEFLSRAVLSASRLNELIENLLAVSKIEQGRMTIKKVKTNITDLIEKSVSELSNFAQSKGLTLTFEKPQKPLPEIMVDPIRIGEVLTNLIGNAINYTPKGSVKVLLNLEKDSVVVAIADTGQGIPQSAIPHLFTKFFRIQGELESGSKGTGLGLYISKNIIESHGGKIWVESKVNEGSTFYFSIPLTQ